jgi:putative ABC transport system permease protein
MNIIIKHVLRNIKVSVDGVASEFEIAGIAQNSGIFSGEARTKTAIMPLNTVQDILGCGEQSNNIHVFLNETISKTDAVNALECVYPELTVEETVSGKEINAQTGQFSMTFFLMFAAACGMCVFIIYSSFRVVIAGRTPTLGTFRSIGASKRTANLILFLDILFYGVISGILACTLGIALLSVGTTERREIGAGYSGSSRRFGGWRRLCQDRH